MARCMRNLVELVRPSDISTMMATVATSCQEEIKLAEEESKGMVPTHSSFLSLIFHGCSLHHHSLFGFTLPLLLPLPLLFPLPFPLPPFLSPSLYPSSHPPLTLLSPFPQPFLPLHEGLSLELNKVQQHILGQREFSKILMDEISFLTVTSHAHMKELVRVTRLMRQALHDLDPLLDTATLLETFPPTQEMTNCLSPPKEMCSQ